MELTLPRDARYVPLLRHVTQQVLGELDAPPGVTADITMAITEACANVVRHAGGTGYSVTLCVGRGVCEVEVIDLGAGLRSPRGAAAGLLGQRARLLRPVVEVATERESGRGVSIMRALVDHFQFTLEPSSARVRLVKRWPVLARARV